MTDSFSLVVPSYKQEKTIVSDVLHLNKVLSKLLLKYEIIVVIDGRIDKSEQKLKRVKNKNLKIISYENNQGKGYAVKKGMLSAKSSVIGFIDSGRDIESGALSIALELMELHNADIVLGSKLHPDSVVNYPLSRKILSFGYRTMIHTLFKLDIKDTQVGLKIFKKKVAKDVFSRIIIKKYAFDIEVLAVAKMLGYGKIYESPIKIKFKQATITNTNFWQISLWMFWDTCAVFYRMNFLHYYSKKR